ncbi:MAG: tyrosine-protein phosphatase [Comamonas sp.]|nr:tyrosine-protein phosphatase [Comamonas sp.]
MTQNPPSRHIALPGTTNFRDLGGYAGHAGHSVRWRVLFRSDHLAGLSPEALQTLNSLGVRRSADFRGVQERTVDGYLWPQLAVHALTVEPTVVQKAIALVHAGGTLTAAETVGLMQDTYRSFVRENAARFAELFALLLESEEPTVFHCTAGKDRTGWAAALVLEALGVSRADIEHDYLLTNQFYQRPTALAARAAQTVPQEILDVLWKVQPEFLSSAYDMVEREYGSIDTYLREAMQLDTPALQELRRRYLVAPR